VNIVMTGGNGFIGRRLARELLAGGEAIGADDTRHRLEKLVLFDVARLDDELARDSRVEQIVGDIGDPTALSAAIGAQTAAVFHFGAVVSAGAEADFDLGMRVNLDGTRNVLEACRRLPSPPRVVFASSLAVYGGELPKFIDDETPSYPQTSYGAQKACGELLVSDYSRKGFVDGRALRFPTILVRPEPNLAASTFASTIIREPLLGRETTCPVEPRSVMAVMSIERLIDCIVLAYKLPAGAFGLRRALLLPAISASVEAMIAAVRRVGGEAAAKRITLRTDPKTQHIVDGWPGGVRAQRAESLGLRADATVEEIVGSFVHQDLPAMLAAAAR
jgi:nucleoside-diphosphate-sugar epimerase